MRGDFPLISGTIEQQGVSASFIYSDNKFIFLPGKHAFNPVNQGVIKQENGFIKGTTHKGNCILIYSPDDIELRPTFTLDTWLYIIFNRRYEDKCSSIRFKSGVLKSLFIQRSLTIGGWSKTSKQDYEISDDSIKIQIDDGFVDYIKIYSGVKWRKSIRDGSSLQNDGVNLELVFKKKQSISDVFQNYYNNIVALCEFMTFRKSISFEKAELTEYRENEMYHGFMKIADCYIKSEYRIENDRDSIRCITFNELGNNTSELYKIITKRNAKRSKFCIGFIPENKSDRLRMTGKKIRDICTSIEVEAGLSGVEVNNNEDFLSVVSEIVKVLHASKDRLTDKEYIFLKGNIDHWNGPAAELAQGLYNKFKKEVEPLLNIVQLDELSFDDINELIRIRNTLTHGGQIILNERDAESALIMMGVVYASVLKRCGCESAQIAEWFKNGLLTFG